MGAPYQSAHTAPEFTAVFDLPPDRELTPIELGDALAQYLAKDHFFKFRRFMHPDMAWNWWTREVCDHLEQFYYDCLDGKRPRLVLNSPPQSGKSFTMEDFIAWVAGKQSSWKTIFASYSDELGVRCNNALFRMLNSERYALVFPDMVVDIAGYRRNQNMIEYANDAGSFRNTTVKGSINGLELHLGVIDDPIKDRAAASSKGERDRAWNWLADDFLSRFHKDAGFCFIGTRWHVDDPIGRYIERYKDVQVFKYPAIAEHDEPHRKKGEALFEEWKPLSFLYDRKKLLTEASWQSLYQQHPIVVTDGMIPVEKLAVLPRIAFRPADVQRSVRYIDKAGTEGGTGAATAMVLMHKMLNDVFIIEHVARGHWGALEREQKIKDFATRDREIYKGNYEVWVEQEPGSGGKESAEATIRNLAGFRVFADRVTGSKVVRAEPFAAQVQGNNVKLLEGSWTEAFIDECSIFPQGARKDQVDAAAGAFNKLTNKGSYIEPLNYKQWAF